MNRTDATRSDDRVPWWIVALAVVAGVAVLAVVVVAVGPRRGDDAATPTTMTPPNMTSTTAPAADDPVGGPVAPSGRVAYVDAAGGVLLGTGAETPVQIASGAALGEADLAAVAVAPTADQLAYVRADGALVLVPLGVGNTTAGEPLVLATDVAVDAIGGGRVLAWDATGTSIAYVAAGTEDMAAPRSEEPPPLSNFTGVYRAPLPEGVLGNVVKVVDRNGDEVVRIGDPSLRSMVGVAASGSDELMLLESVVPDTGRPYTLSLATAGSSSELPTVLSADEPAFASDGNFVVAVGPSPAGQELLRIATDALERATLVAAEQICSPSISPDSTRIVYGAGPDCSQLWLVSSRGGAPVDITPPAGPGTRTFRYGELGWTVEGRWITYSDCRVTDGTVRCGDAVTFLDPDQRRVLEGPTATTVAPHNRPLLQDLRLDLVMAGPLTYEIGYDVTTEVESDLTTVDDASSRLSAEFADGERRLGIDLQIEGDSQFATGRMTVVDPDAGIDRSFLVLGTPVVLGTRVVSLSGFWLSTDELPVISGEFRLGVRRG